MKLLQLTDIHLTKPGNTIAGRDPNANFDRALAHALEQHADADALFITGDLSDWGERDDYLRLKESIANLPMPVHLLIGNHDDRPTMLGVFPELANDDGFVQHRIDLPFGTALTLDTWGPESHAGHYCQKRADWLTKNLEETQGPVWIFLHHNPVPIHVAPMDQIMLLDADLFGTTIAPHAHKIRHIFHGHCHMPLSGSFHGIPFSAPRGTNHQGWPDFAATRLLAGADLTESYAVILADEINTMVHMVEFGYAGDVRSEATPDYADWDQLTMIR